MLQHQTYQTGWLKTSNIDGPNILHTKVFILAFADVVTLKY